MKADQMAVKRGGKAEGERGQRETLIGILTTGSKEESPPLQARHLLRSFIRAARELHACAFFFTPQDIHWDTAHIWGHTLVGKGRQERWVVQRFPFPSVIYNRIPHRSAERWPSVLYAKRELQEQYNIPIFNPAFFEKREVYRLLQQAAVTRPFLPITKLWNSPAVLQQMLNHFPHVYAKPIHGSLGVGIMQIRQQEEGAWELRYQSRGRAKSFRFSRADLLDACMRRLAGHRPYVLQQGIQLREVEGRPTDFRLHLNKNGSGAWEVIGIGGKVAGAGAVTTHVHNGGTVMQAEKILQQWYGNEAEEQKRRLMQQACLIAVTLEGQMDGFIGELGLDMGIDQEDRLWLFEANAKPGRAIFRHPALRQAGRQSARKVIEYGLWLAGLCGRKDVCR